MEFNNPSEIVKDLTFGNAANEKIMAGVSKLANAVKSTLGASGKCVIYEDALGRPVITKDGVTVAESVVLMDPVENIGATLVKEAARNTVREAGDGTTTSTVLAHSLLKELSEFTSDDKIREIKKALKTVLRRSWNILILPVFRLMVKCLGKLHTLAQTTTKSLEASLVKLSAKLAKMESY